MGNFFETIIVKHVQEDQATDVAEQIRAWLIENKIIESELSDCIYGVESAGHRPGKAYENAMVQDEDLNREHILGLHVNGVEFNVGRQQFLGMWNISDELKIHCKRCGEHKFVYVGDTHVSELMREALYDYELLRNRTIYDNLTKAIQNWEDRSAETSFSCPKCSFVEPVDEWEFGDTVGLGNVGITFWNWDLLDKSFVEKLGKVVGYKVISICGKL